MKKSNIIKIVASVIGITVVATVCMVFAKEPNPIGYGVNYKDSIDKLMEEREIVTELPEKFQVALYKGGCPYPYFEIIDDNTFISYSVREGKVTNIYEHNLITKDNPEEVEAIVEDLVEQMTAVYGEPLAVFGENDVYWSLVEDCMEGYYSLNFEPTACMTCAFHYITVNVDGQFEWNGDC